MAHRLAPEAAADLDDIWHYVATASGGVARADRLVDALTNRFHLLATYPRLGRARDDLRPGLRGFPVSDYIILYRIEREVVLILRVLHGRSDIASWLVE